MKNVREPRRPFCFIFLLKRVILAQTAILPSMQSESPEIILASASGARAAILASAGVRFRQQPSMLDEIEEQKHLKPGTPPDEVARTLARLKADDVLKAEPNAIVIGADQVLAIGSEIVQKPKSQE